MSTVSGATGASAVARTPRDVPGWWVVAGIRAVTMLVLGLTITFSADHSSFVGMIGLGCAAVIGGGAQLALRARASTDAVTRTLIGVAGLVSLAAGLAAFAFSGAGPVVFVPLAAAYAAVTGGLELAAGLRDRGRNRAARDWVAAGVLALLLAAALAVVPPELSQPFRGERGNTGVLTGSLIAVGLLGAWGVMTGVLLAISSLSLRGRA